MAAHARDAELEALEILDRLDLLAEPAAHLRAGVAAQDGMRLEGFSASLQSSAPPPNVHQEC